jgi:hypothetical protein
MTIRHILSKNKTGVVDSLFSGSILVWVYSLLFLPDMMLGKFGDRAHILAKTI